MKINQFVTLVLLGLVGSAHASSLDLWIEEQAKFAKSAMQANISAPGTHSGSVIASPQRDNPDYFFHWVRDSALVMQSLIQISASEKAAFEKTFEEYLVFSRMNQTAGSVVGLGEPRFNVDGSLFTGNWSRPQNDGPALRTLTLISYLSAASAGTYQLSKSSEALIQIIMKADLDYLVKNWSLPDFDLWEELKGQHYDTRLKQAQALKLGAEKMRVWNDPERSALYGKTSDQVFASLESFWQPKQQVIAANLSRVEGAENKKTILDTAVILAVLHTNRRTGSNSVSDDRMIKTVYEIESMFSRVYTINAKKNLPPAIGRYEDDVYFGGNPWYLTTAALAEYYYRLALVVRTSPEFSISGTDQVFFKALDSKFKQGPQSETQRLEISQLLRERGDAYLLRIKEFTPPGGHWSEQFHRDTGVPLSARDLTWSYAGFLTAVEARKDLK